VAHGARLSTAVLSVAVLFAIVHISSGAVDHYRGVNSMLQLKPNCECCGRILAPDSVDARICSFECTFCAECAETKLKSRCPNCGGELVARPRRPVEKLAQYPASTEPVVRPDGCTPLAV